MSVLRLVDCGGPEGLRGHWKKSCAKDVFRQKMTMANGNSRSFLA